MQVNFSAEIISGRYALNRGKLTRAQLQKCIEEQGRLKEQGVEKPIFELMVEYGFVDIATARQIKNLEGMIPGYNIIGVIGTGGLGVLYKAYAHELKATVAIKILNPENTDNSVVVNRFLREVEVSKQLNHKNIVKGIDSGRIEDLYYLVLEYIDGDNLRIHVGDKKPMAEKDVLTVAANVTNALYYAWSKGLTHRDIKPENIMLTQEGIVKVCDLGLAKLADSNIALTLAGSIVGSPYYISPEQVTSSSDVDYRSDIYSLGATLYYISTARVLFPERTMIAICNAHLNKEPQPPSKYAKICPDLEYLILQMLRKNPQERCKSKESFVRDMGVIVRKFEKKYGQGLGYQNSPLEDPMVITPPLSETAHDMRASDIYSPENPVKQGTEQYPIMSPLIDSVDGVKKNIEAADKDRLRVSAEHSTPKKKTLQRFPRRGARAPREESKMRFSSACCSR